MSNKHERNSGLHEQALELDSQLGEMVEKREAESAQRALEILEKSESYVSQEQLEATTKALDQLLGVEKASEVSMRGAPEKRSYRKQLEGGFSAKCIVFDHPKVNREYIVSYPSDREGIDRVDTVILVKPDGSGAVLNEDIQSVDGEESVLSVEYGTDVDLITAQATASSNLR